MRAGVGGVPPVNGELADPAACVAKAVRDALNARAVAIACVDDAGAVTLEATAGASSPDLQAVLRSAALAPRVATGSSMEPASAGAASRFVVAPLEAATGIATVLVVDLGEEASGRDVAVAVIQALARPLAVVMRAAAHPGMATTDGRATARRLAVVAHELRRPLAPIASGVTVLRRHGADVDVRGIAGMIDRQVRDLARLVQDLLDEEPADAFDFSVRTQHVDLVVATQDAVQSVLPLVAARRHRVASSIEAVALPVSADPLRLRQIIVNLLENAAKYTPAGGRLDVDVRRDGEYAILEVRDSGLGISAERLATIFEDAPRPPPRPGGGGGGRGVGLPLVRRLVLRHGGTVAAESDGPGRGSRFTVRLPLAAGCRAGSGRLGRAIGAAP